MTLTPGPDLDRRVCEVLSIPKRRKPRPMSLMMASAPASVADWAFPAVSTDPTTIPMLMTAIKKKFGRCILIASGDRWIADTDTIDGSVGECSSDHNLALCKLALSLAPQTTEKK